jgi:hypothetical protein
MVLAAGTAGIFVLGACKPGAVRVDFRPQSGSSYTYAIDVKAATTTAIDGRPPSRSESDEHLEAHHVVQAVEGGGVIVDVKVTGDGVPERTFEVTLDRAGSLVAVQRVEDIPTSLLGDLGLSEVFPAAAGAPPDHKLRPGTGWKINEPVTLPGTLSARLTGSGRLVDLGVVSGRQVATIKSAYVLPVHQTTSNQDGTVTLDGRQTTETTATHALQDGAVQSVQARTTGHFAMTLAPPGGTNGPVLTGHLDLDVESTTRRQG